MDEEDKKKKDGEEPETSLDEQLKALLGRLNLGETEPPYIAEEKPASVPPPAAEVEKLTPTDKELFPELPPPPSLPPNPPPTPPSFPAAAPSLQESFDALVDFKAPPQAEPSASPTPLSPPPPPSSPAAASSLQESFDAIAGFKAPPQAESRALPAPPPPAQGAKEEAPVAEEARAVPWVSPIKEGPPWRRPLLSLGQTTILTLDIEGNSVRFLVARGKRVETWGTVGFKPGLLRQGLVAQAPEAGAVLAASLKARGVQGGRVVCALPSLGTMTRIFSLPRGAEKALDSLVLRESRRAGFNPDNYYLFWQSLAEKTGPLRVFVVGVPREPVATLVEAFGTARLSPRALDLKPLALARAVGRKEAILAQVEVNGLEMAVVVNHIPRLLRSVYLGEDSTPEGAALRLPEELGRTIDFLATSQPELAIDPTAPVYLAGELADYPGLAVGVEAQTGHRVESLRSPLRAPPDFPLAAFVVNIGLAMKKL